MKKIHVVHIIPTLNFGGAERFVVDLSNNLDEDKFEVTIILLKKEDALKVELKRRVKVVYVIKQGKISFGLFGKLKKKLKSLKPDIVHTHLFGGDFWGRVAAHSLNIPIVTTEHTINTEEGFLRSFFKKMLKNWTDVYTVPSSAAVEFMKAKYNIQRPIYKIPHGIELRRFQNIRPAMIKKIFKLLILGRLEHEKGHKVAMAALSGLKSFSWHLTIIGEGKKEEEIKEFAQKIGISDKISFEKPSINVPEFMKTQNIVLVPSLQEAQGIVAMEAMAAGRLVIASNVGGLKDIIIDKHTGLFFQKERYDDLRSKLHFVFNHSHSAETMAREAKNFAMTHFGIEEMVKKYEGIYLSLKRF